MQAHSTLRYAAWRQVIDEFVAERTGQRPGALAMRQLAAAFADGLAPAGTDVAVASAPLSA